jgi:ankyrin repeat protein
MIKNSPTFPEGVEPECDWKEIMEPIIHDDQKAFAEFEINGPNEEITFKNAHKSSMLANSPSLACVCLVYGAEKCFDYLINKFKRVPLTCDKRGRLPIMFAAAGGNFSLFKQVCKNFSGTTSPDNLRANVFHHAAKYNQMQILQYCFLHNLPINSTKDGATPLMWACMNNAVDAIKFLIDNELQDINDKTSGNWTSLHYAAADNCVDAVKTLLTYEKIAFIRNIKNLNPLHIALGNGCVENVKAFVDAGFVTSEDDALDYIKYILSASTQSSDEQKLDCLSVFLNSEKLLKDYGEKLLTDALNEAYNAINVDSPFSLKAFARVCEDVNKHTDYIQAVSITSLASKIVKDKQKGILIIDALCNMSKFEPNMKHKDGKNLIHDAMIEGNEKMVQKLIEHGVDPNQDDKNGNLGIDVRCNH